MAEHRETLNEEQETQIINEEYKIWKKNVPYLYDLSIVHELDFPSLTIQWLPVRDSPLDKDYTIHKCIMATSSTDGEPNALLIAKVRVPKEDKVDVQLLPHQVHQMQENRVEVETRIIHTGEINKARYCPQKYNVIATHSNNGQINIFDYSKHASQPIDQDMHPQLVLQGHTQEGYGLCWNSQQEGLLASSANDATVRLWDIEQAKELQGTVQPVHTLQEHKAEVNDVAFVKSSPALLLSCSDDKTIILWDIRASNKAQLAVQAHHTDIFTIDTNPFDDKAFLSGSGDNSIKMWDLRNLKTRVHCFENHTDDVLHVEYSPSNGAVFGSCSKDRRVNLWDISRIGQDLKQEDVADGPSELLFVHGGHKSCVDDFTWDTNQEFLLASVEQQYSVLQVWQMASILYIDDDE